MSFVHDDPDFDGLLRIVANNRGLGVALVEKDYWVTHTLWALHAHDDRWHTVQKAHDAIGPMFWGPRLSVFDACADICTWLDTELGP